jgi:hypothetical protein
LPPEPLPARIRQVGRCRIPRHAVLARLCARSATPLVHRCVAMSSVPDRRSGSGCGPG